MARLFNVQWILIQIAYYIAYGFGAYLVARRLGRNDAWIGFIPILNIYLVCQMARKDTSFMVWVFLSAFFCSIISMVMLAFAWADIAQYVGKDRWYGYLTLIPLVGLVPIFLMGMGEPIVTGYGANPMLVGLEDRHRQGSAYQQAVQRSALPPRADGNMGAYAPTTQGFPPPQPTSPVPPSFDPLGDGASSDRPRKDGDRPPYKPTGWV